MKVAVVGAGPLGLEASLTFQQMDARVVLFSADSQKEQRFLWGKQFSEGTWGEITSAAGRSLVGLSPNLENVPTLEQYAGDYFFPLRKACLVGDVVLRPWRVLRAHKRLLVPGESVPGKTRLTDLFRVVYQRPGREGEECEDFDLLVDATGPACRALPLGASGVWAMGESKLAHLIDYGESLLENRSKISACARVAIVGSGVRAARALQALSGSDCSITLVTPEREPFGEVAGVLPGPWMEATLRFLEQQRREWQSASNTWEADLRRWRELPDYQRAKIPRPEMPTQRLTVLSGYSVTAVDKWEDREGLFLTCETEDWRAGGAPPLRTLCADRVLAATGIKAANPVFEGLATGRVGERGLCLEPGFYHLGQRGKFYSLRWGLHQLQWIVQDVLRFFSRV